MRLMISVYLFVLRTHIQMRGVVIRSPPSSIIENVHMCIHWIGLPLGKATLASFKIFGGQWNERCKDT